MKYFRTYQLALALFKEGEKLPLTGELKDQFHRASLSVVLNLAEGSAKIGRERLRFFRTAMGSLREVQACLEVIGSPLVENADQVAGSLHKLLKNPGPGL